MAAPIDPPKKGCKENHRSEKSSKWITFVVAAVCIGIGVWITWAIIDIIFSVNLNSTAAPVSFFFLLGLFLVLKNGLGKGLAILGTILAVCFVIWAVFWFTESPEYRAGMKAYDKEDFTTAVEKFSIVLADDPKNSEVYLKRGQALWRLGKTSEALLDLNRAIKLDYVYKDESYAARGLVYADLENPQAAADDFSVAIKELPSATDLCNRGIMYNRLKRFDLAIKDFKRALKLDDDYTNALWGMGDAFYHQGQWRNALIFYEKYVKSSDKMPEGLKSRIKVTRQKLVKEKTETNK